MVRETARLMLMDLYGLILMMAFCEQSQRLILFLQSYPLHLTLGKATIERTAWFSLLLVHLLRHKTSLLARAVPLQLLKTLSLLRRRARLIHKTLQQLKILSLL